MAPRSTLDQDGYLDINGELMSGLEDLQNVENKNLRFDKKYSIRK